MIENMQPHLSELFKRIKHIGIAFVIVLSTVFMFNPLKMTFGITGSFTVYIFKLISENIGGMKIITISPFESLFTDLYLGVTISIMIILPYIIWNLIAFILPGMTVREKRLLKISLIPGTIMFIIKGISNTRPNENIIVKSNVINFCAETVGSMPIAGSRIAVK